MTTPMSDEEAKKEHDEIQAEIAKSKGLDPETGKPVETDKKPEDEVVKDGDKEPVDDEEDKSDKKDEDSSEKTGEKDQDVDLDKIRRRHIPLSKYQDLKRTSREEMEAKDKKIADLQALVDSRKTDDQVGEEIKVYAEKYGMSEEQVKDQFAIFDKKFGKKDEPNPILTKAEVIIKKDEAKQAFEDEFSELLNDLPEASEAKDKIRKEAFKDENLNKSLYEIYLRNVKPTIIPKKKTGESSRGSVRNESKDIDYSKIIENVKNNVSGALNGLTGEQQDKVFEMMEKSGSRYK